MNARARRQLVFLLPISLTAAAAGAYSGHNLLMAAGILLVPVWFMFVDGRPRQ